MPRPFVRTSPQRRPTRRSPRQRGAALLLILVFISLLSLTASSLSLASVDQMEIARDESRSLQAELLAESAMAYAIRQVALDPEWEGTDGQEIALGEAGTFAVEFVGEGEGGGKLIRMSGIGGGAEAILQAEVLFGEGGPGGTIKSCGLVTLGGDFDANNVDVNAGSVLIVDDEDGVLDYDPAAEDWVDPGISDPTITINNFHVEGILHSFNGVDGPNVTYDEASLASTAVRTPHVNLEWFLEPNVNITVVTSGTLKNLTTNKTVVVNVPVGTHISMDNCKLYGGLVVYAEDTYTPRGTYRNTMEWKKCTFGKATNPGVLPGLGVIAPATHVTHSHTQNSGYGLFYVKSADHFNAITVTAGAVFILDFVGQMNGVEITFDDSIWDGQFDPYIDWGETSTKLLGIQEYYPEP
jgi:hypothetical protein